MKRITLMGTMMVMTLILGLMGCQMFDDSPTEVGSLNADATVVSDFIMGDPELDTWGVYYEEGDTFARVDIPVAGAIKIEYTTTGGFSGAIFLQTYAPVGLEIGLNDDDVLADLSVSYVEGGGFTATPANVEADEHGDWTEYKRLNDDGSTSNWWPANAGFVFSDETTTTCGVVNGETQWEMIPGGAFVKPSPGGAVGKPSPEVNDPVSTCVPGYVLLEAYGPGGFDAADNDEGNIDGPYSGSKLPRDGYTRLVWQRDGGPDCTVDVFRTYDAGEHWAWTADMSGGECFFEESNTNPDQGYRMVIAY